VVTLQGDVQEQIGSEMTGIDYPRSQPTPEALVAAARTAGTTRVQQGRDIHRKEERVRQHGRLELKRMIDAGADVDGETAFKDTALKAAAGSGNTAAIDLLLDAGASVDLCGATYLQHTPLLVAAKAGHAKATALLLSRGADPNRTGVSTRAQAMVACGVLVRVCR